MSIPPLFRVLGPAQRLRCMARAREDGQHVDPALVLKEFEHLIDETEALNSNPRTAKLLDQAAAATMRTDSTGQRP